MQDKRSVVPLARATAVLLLPDVAEFDAGPDARAAATKKVPTKHPEQDDLL